MIFNFGIVSFYTLLASYRRTKKEKDYEKLKELWLKNAMSFEYNLDDRVAKFSVMLKKTLLHKINSDKINKKLNTTLENEEKNNYLISDLKQEEFIAEAKKLEDVFSKMFPERYEEFQECENSVNSEDNKFYRDVCFEHPEYLL